jgi:hypothetical protein
MDGPATPCRRTVSLPNCFRALHDAGDDGVFVYCTGHAPLDACDRHGRGCLRSGRPRGP